MCTRKLKETWLRRHTERRQSHCFVKERNICKNIVNKIDLKMWQPNKQFYYLCIISLRLDSFYFVYFFKCVFKNIKKYYFNLPFNGIKIIWLKAIIKTSSTYLWLSKHILKIINRRIIMIYFSTKNNFCVMKSF